MADDDGEVVGAWEDKTANEDDLTQGTSDNKPTLQTNELNGEPVLRFDGSNDNLQGAFTTGGALSQPFTILIVAKLDAGAVNDDNYHILIDSDDSSNRMLAGNQPTDTPDTWRIYAGTNLDSANASDSDWNIWTCLYDGASSQFWHSGVSQASGNAGAHDGDGLTVGTNYNQSGAWDGDVAEILIYDSDLSDADKNEVGNYLGDRYDISYSDIT